MIKLGGIGETGGVREIMGEMGLMGQMGIIRLIEWGGHEISVWAKHRERLG